MYGYRARIGYTSPPMLTETFAYEFYKMVPEGVTLILTTLKVRQRTPAEVQESLELSFNAAGEMAKAGASVVVLGGIPINLAWGYDRLEELLSTARQRCSAPVLSSVTAQIQALDQLGAKRLGVIHPFSAHIADYAAYLPRAGFEVAAVKPAGYTFEDLGRVDEEVPVRLARELVREHPEIDTIYFPAPHWPVVMRIDAMEQELGRHVVSAVQAIIWDALRASDVGDAIDGFGRLLREH